MTQTIELLPRYEQTVTPLNQAEQLEINEDQLTRVNYYAEDILTTTIRGPKLRRPTDLEKAAAYRRAVTVITCSEVEFDFGD